MVVKIYKHEQDQVVTLGKCADEGSAIYVCSKEDFDAALRAHRNIYNVYIAWVGYETLVMAEKLMGSHNVEISFGHSIFHNTAINGVYCFCSDPELLGLESF